MIENSLFWRFWTPANPEPSLIYGTIHLNSPKSLTFWDKVCSCIDNYEVIFTESSLDEESRLFSQQFSLLPSSLNPFQFISEKRWRKMRKVFLKYCKVDIDLFRGIHPLFLLSHLQMTLIEQGSGGPLDKRIWDYALSQGKRVGGIESSAKQVEILQSLDIEGMYKQIVRMSKRISKTRKVLAKIQNLYEQQDITQLYKSSKSSLGKDKSSLIAQRNELMARQLFVEHNKQSSFFSFGAGHLAGGNGVLRHLKRNGAIIKAEIIIDNN